MSRSSFRAGLWLAQLGAVVLMLTTAPPAQAQFLKRLKKYAQKAQDIHKSTTITDEQEKELGREVAAKFIDYYHLYSNEEVTRYVNLVGQTVAAQSERQDIQYHFAVLDSDDINAFSTPGGFIFVTRGALALCEDESELAGVLGHEVAHVADKDVIHVVERDKTMLAGMQEASAHMQSNQWQQYLQNASKKILVTVIDQGLAPADEYNADQKGVTYAYKAGYPADGLERFLTKLNQATDQGAHSFWTRTHPPVPDRNTRIQQLITSNRWQDAERPKLADRFAQMTAVLKPKT
jgi:predicted Zn-dependent protease